MDKKLNNLHLNLGNVLYVTIRTVFVSKKLMNVVSWRIHRQIIVKGTFELLKLHSQIILNLE